VVIANGIVNACKFSAKTGEPAGPMSCGRARELDGVRKSAKYQAISMSIKNSEEQRRTAKRTAVFCGIQLAASEDFCGKADVARCKFSGRTAETSTRTSRSLHAAAMVRTGAKPNRWYPRPQVRSGSRAALRTGYQASGFVKGFGRRPIATVGQALGPSSESPQGRNPRGGEVGKAPRAMAI
jgi:hypothetical protein